MENRKRSSSKAYATAEKPRPKPKPFKGLDDLVFRNRRDTPEEGIPVVAVLIDGYNARYEDQLRAARAAAAVIEKREEKALWGVYFLGFRGIRVLHDYSTNTESVSGRLRRLRESGNPEEGLEGEANDVPRIELIRQIESRTGRLPVSDTQERAVMTRDALGAIARYLSALPGRKSLIWMTAGLSLTEAATGSRGFWRSTLDTLNNANVAVYSIDSGGVRTDREFHVDVPASWGLARRPDLRDPLHSTRILASVSEATGGRWFANSNDLEEAAEGSLSDAKAFYTLAYRTTQSKADGRRVKLEVKTPKLKGVELRHRESYTVWPLTGIAEEERERLLADAIVSPLEAIEIGVLARLPGTEAARTLDLALEPGALTLEKAAGQIKMQLYIRCVQASAEGKVIEDFTDELNLSLKPNEAERVHREGLQYRRRIQLRPQAQVLKVAVCDQATGRVGSLRIELPGS